ncbi:MAG: hypothetical protein IPH04_01365 [Saprospirales bacterium]|nr:hypothetical protein [Saprospirales bacterium]
MHKRDFNVFGGFDIVVGGASVDYTAIYPGFKDESYQGRTFISFYSGFTSESLAAGSKLYVKRLGPDSCKIKNQ